MKKVRQNLVPADKGSLHTPVGQTSQHQIESIHQLIGHNLNLKHIIDAMPLAVLILNTHRQVVEANQTACHLFNLDVSALLGKRPGQFIQCVYTDDGWTQEGVDMSMHTHQKVSRQCQIRLKDRGSLDCKVTVSPQVLAGQQLICVAIEDRSSHERRQVLERTFFHDVANSITTIIGFARMLDEDTGGTEDHKVLIRVAEELMEEVECHRQLKLAEDGSLVLYTEKIDLGIFLRQLVQLYQSDPTAKGRSVVLADSCHALLHTDPRLLKRILVNMIKNALEASSPKDVITVSCHCDANQSLVSVHNPAVMTDEVKSQIFKRSFSTKGKIGRGIGTYSMKLLGENYLNGQVSFESDSEIGTTFRIMLPTKQSHRPIKDISKE